MAQKKDREMEIRVYPIRLSSMSEAIDVISRIKIVFKLSNGISSPDSVL